MNAFFIQDELIHLGLTLIVAGLFYWRYRNWRLIPAALFFGFLIDLDHFFDYFIYSGLDLHLEKFTDVTNYMEPAGKVYVLLHGWEFIFIFGWLGIFLEKKWKIKGLAGVIVAAYAVHLIKDNLSSLHHPLAYSFLYRLFNAFSGKAFRGKL